MSAATLMTSSWRDQMINNTWQLLRVCSIDWKAMAYI
jgi:hypothetical protein